MTRDLFLRRKWTLRAHGKQVVFVKRANERREHVLMKAFLWALYLPRYPDLAVELSVGSRYKPDAVSFDRYGNHLFWGEAGHVSPSKIHDLVGRHRETHFALAKWDAPLAFFVDIVREAVEKYEPSEPFDLLAFPPDSAGQFIDTRGNIDVSHAALDWVRL
jgi:hypothetical protein